MATASRVPAYSWASDHTTCSMKIGSNPTDLRQSSHAMYAHRDLSETGGSGPGSCPRSLRVFHSINLCAPVPISPAFSNSLRHALTLPILATRVLAKTSLASFWTLFTSS